IFCGSHIAFPVCHLAQQDIVKSVMGSEGITGNKNLFFFNISIHGIRPVQVRYKEETERTVSDLHCHVVSCRNSGKVSVYDLFQESKGTACSDDFHTRVQIQKPLHPACM